VTRRELILALLLLFAYGFFRQAPAWNELSRYDLVRALVEDGTTRIDRFHENTGDKAFFEGHYYSDKAPGTALLGVPAYVVTAAVWEVAGEGPLDESSAVAALAFAVSGVPTVLTVLLLLRFLRSVVEETWALVIAAGFALGSLAFPFATMLFGHAGSSLFLFAAFYLLWRWRTDRGAWRPVVAGLSAGAAVMVEIPVALGVAILGAYALWLGWGTSIRFVLGALAPLGVLAGYNWISFGGPFRLGYQYATNFAEQNRQGIVSIVWPTWSNAADLLFGPRGLVRLAPWFVFAPLGALALRTHRLRAEIVIALAICTAFLVYNSGALNPLGGWTPGPRYLVPALPFAAILIAQSPERVRPAIATLIAVGILFMVIATVTMPNAPEAYEDPLAELWLPRLLGRDVAETLAWQRWGIHGWAVIAVLAGGIAIAALAIVLSVLDRGHRLKRASTVVLAALVITFSVPLLPQRLQPSSVSSDGPVAVVDAGVVPLNTGEARRLMLWSLLENRGPARDATRVEFVVTAADGGTAWSAWHARVSWLPGERRRLTVEWEPPAGPGDAYAFSVRVLGPGGELVSGSPSEGEAVAIDR